MVYKSLRYAIAVTFTVCSSNYLANDLLAIMKYAVTVFAALLLVGVSAFPFSNYNDVELNELDRDIIEFYELIPLDKLQEVVDDHYDDPELHKSLKYLTTDRFHNLMYAVEDLPEFQKYVLYLQEAGYNMIRDLKLTHEILGMKDYVPPNSTTENFMVERKKGGGLNGYIDDLMKILPTEEIRALHEKKVKESPAFAKYKAALSAPEFEEINIALFSQKPVIRLLVIANIHGVNFIKINIFKQKVLGFFD
ncbi:hypothetical protein KPH14_010334 [Odynerus spinipes]|uniref:Protein G12 n=1 Tax=Odynerus spinipes TaxID=1348599 RepID=A0AAD9VSV5_9HYME|nr:hypothetical protein KPH14_010334 [Odynerus spinipes]